MVFIWYGVFQGIVEHYTWQMGRLHTDSSKLGWRWQRFGNHYVLVVRLFHVSLFFASKVLHPEAKWPLARILPSTCYTIWNYSAHVRWLHPGWKLLLDVNLSTSQEEIWHGPARIEISNCQALFNTSTASEKYMYKTSQKSSATTLKAHGQHGQHGQLELPGHLVCSPQEAPKWSHMYILSSRSITMFNSDDNVIL